MTRITINVPLSLYTAGNKRHVFHHVVDDGMETERDT